ncbi:MAG: WYL domain-containing protein [Thermogemmatispora sp.]|uniref:helix-turn-helix transcriptional regulator n=1 Tax=Thermogemmatispora sp. TaxID=1968838 RepID=UPI001D4F17EE|nr:WYL domain-containing protein [Thermogemmatispora sp.]MBX5452294.1 WYL domain-containing protein [Thermogemmatispora sp.]
MDRLTAIVLLLQRGKWTAASLARHFEVSRRTILRDIEALCEMGIPVVAEPGPGGGYSLPADYAQAPLPLSLQEALLLRLALSSLLQLRSVPFKEARASLWAKITALLPSREEIEPGLEQMLSSPSSARAGGAEFPVPFFSDLLQALAAGQWVRVTYRSERRQSEQTLLPQRLSANAGLWYCHAYSLEHGCVRLYRVDRLLRLEALTGPPCAEQPEIRDRREDPTFPEVCIRLTERGVLRLEHYSLLAARLQREADGSGWLRLPWNPDDYDWLARQLLSLGPEARVLTPTALRERLQTIARQIATQYEKDVNEGEEW